MLKHVGRRKVRIVRLTDAAASNIFDNHWNIESDFKSYYQITKKFHGIRYIQTEKPVISQPAPVKVPPMFYQPCGIRIFFSFVISEDGKKEEKVN